MDRVHPNVGTYIEHCAINAYERGTLRNRTRFESARDSKIEANVGRGVEKQSVTCNTA